MAMFHLTLQFIHTGKEVNILLQTEQTLNHQSMLLSRIIIQHAVTLCRTTQVTILLINL